MTRRGKRRLIALLTITLLGALAVGALRTIQSVQDQRLMAKARRDGLAAYAEGDLDRALQKLDYYLERIKDDLEVNLAFAEARLASPQADGAHLAEALAYYTTHGLSLIDNDKTIANRDQRRCEVLQRVLELYSRLGLRGELIQTADRILTLDPHSVDALAAKAQVLYLERRLDEAAAVVDRLIELDPDTLSWRRLMLAIQSDLGTSRAALQEQCRQWAESYAGDGRFHLLNAAMLLEDGHRTAARRALESMVKKGAQISEVLEQGVLLLDLLELRELATHLIAATQQKFPATPWVREISVRRLWRAHCLDEALAELDQAQRVLGQLEPQLQRLRVLALVSSGRPEQAREALQTMLRASRSDADRAWALAVAAVLEPSETKCRHAVEALEHAISLWPGDSAIHLLMGELYAKAGASSQALTAYHQAHELDSNWVAAGTAYAEALLTAGRIEQAHKISRVVINRCSKDFVPGHVLFARTYLAMRRCGESSQLEDDDDGLESRALAVLEQAHAERPNDTDVAVVLCETYLQSGSAERAAELISRAGTMANASAEMLWTLAGISLKHRLGMEQLLLDQARSIGGMTVPWALMQARVLAANGDAAAGLAVIDQALLTDRLDPLAMRRAQCARAAYMLDSNHSQAQAVLERLAVEHPGSIEVQQFALAQPAIWNDSHGAGLAIDNLKKLLGEYSAAVRLAEANLFIRHQRGDEALLAKALMSIDSVLEQSPDSLAALSLRAEGSLLGPHPNLDRAVECLERAVNLYTAEPNLVIRLVSLVQNKGEFDKADRYLRDLTRHDTCHPSLQLAMLKTGHDPVDFEAALARASVSIDESSRPFDQLSLAASQCHDGRYAESEQIYQRLLNVPQPDPLVLSQAAEFYANTDQFERGLALLYQLPRPPGQSGEVIIGAFHARHARPQEAERLLRRAIEVDPSSIEARVELARHYLSQHDRQKAGYQALEGLKIDATNSALRTMLAVASLGNSSQDRQQAISVLRERCPENDDLLASLMFMEQAPVHAGQPAPAESDLAAVRKLVEEHDRFWPAWLLAISRHVDAGRTADAVALARLAANRFPSQPEPSQWAAGLLIQLHQWSDALVEARHWRRRAPGPSLPADMAIASILIELDRASEAAAQLAPYAGQLDQVAANRPDQFALWLKVLAHSGEFDRAASLADPLLKTDIKWRRVWLAVARALDDDHAHQALFRLEPAVVEPQEMIGLAEAWTDLGLRGARRECFDHAEALAARAAGHEGFAAEGLVAQGAVAEARGDRQAAEQLYRRVLELQPDHAVALNNLACVLAVSPEGCTQALSYIEMALNLQPDQPDLLDTYAQVLWGLNRLKEAEDALNEALALRPDDLSMAMNLAELQLHQHRLDDAARTLDQAHRLMTAAPRPHERHQGRLDLLRRQLENSQTLGGS